MTFIATKSDYGDIHLSYEHAEGLSHLITIGDHGGAEEHNRRIADAINWFYDTKPEVIDPQVERAKKFLEEAGYTVEKAEPEVLRTWERLEDIPEGTHFTEDDFWVSDDIGNYYISNGDGTAYWVLGGHHASVYNEDGPFHEIPKEFRK